MMKELLVFFTLVFGRAVEGLIIGSRRERGNTLLLVGRRITGLLQI